MNAQLNQDYFTPAIIAEWSPKTQSLSNISDAHFDVFNARKCALKKSEQNQLSKLLVLLGMALDTLNANASETGAVRKLYKKSFDALQKEYAKADAQIAENGEMSRHHVLIATALLSVKNAAWDALPETDPVKEKFRSVFLSCQRSR